MTFQAAMRAAAVTMLEAYATAGSIKLQVYPARPRTLLPPTAFVDGIRETLPSDGSMMVRRLPVADVIVVHGLFDSRDAADQKDAFVDGFIAYVLDNVHAAGPNTTVVVTETEDLPAYVPDWLPPAEQKTYYATRIALEGLALSG